MTDLALHWNGEASGADIALDGGNLATDAGLRTAVILSLFTNARARPDDELPTPDADPQGWWGNAFPANDDDGERELGSRLWLLSRAKTLATALIRAREYCAEALQWLVDDGVASAVEVAVERQTRDGTETLAIGVVITRPNGADVRYDLLWKATT